MKVVVVTDPVRSNALEMVSELCRMGYFVIAIAKDAKDSEMVYKTVMHRYNFAKIATFVGTFDSIRNLRQIVLNIKLLATEHKFNSIYALICNQEKAFEEFEINEDGIEMTFLYNYITNIFLSVSLVDFLQREKGSRIILPTLEQSQLVGINLKDVYRQNAYSAQSALRQAKFANALMAGYFNELYNNGDTPARTVLYRSRDVSKDEDIDKEKEQSRLARLMNKPTEFEVLRNTVLALVNVKNFSSMCYADSKPVQAPSIVANKEMGRKFWALSEKISRLRYYEF